MTDRAMVPLHLAEVAVAALLADNGVEGQAKIDHELSVFRMELAALMDHEENPDLPPTGMPR